MSGDLHGGPGQTDHRAGRRSGGCPKTFTLPERREIQEIAKSEQTERDLTMRPAARTCVFFTP
ncbi:hypothetical protein [Streptomyces sp. NBC_00111]|uniref:hypothetical protein n=1 Tax=Streptomyces sp. NBC_00111 TaxID=2975655 RepID=UPI003867ABC6